MSSPLNGLGSAKSYIGLMLVANMANRATSRSVAKPLPMAFNRILYLACAVIIRIIVLIYKITKKNSIWAHC